MDKHNLDNKRVYVRMPWDDFLNAYTYELPGPVGLHSQNRRTPACSKCEDCGIYAIVDQRNPSARDETFWQLGNMAEIWGIPLWDPLPFSIAAKPCSCETGQQLQAMIDEREKAKEAYMLSIIRRAMDKDDANTNSD